MVGLRITYEAPDGTKKVASGGKVKGKDEVITAKHLFSDQKKAVTLPDAKEKQSQKTDSLSSSQDSSGTSAIKDFSRTDVKSYKVKVEVVNENNEVLETTTGKAKSAGDANVTTSSDVPGDVAMITLDKTLTTKVEEYPIAKPGSKHDPKSYRVENSFPGGKAEKDINISPEGNSKPGIPQFNNPGQKIQEGASGAIVTAINLETGEREIVSNVSVGNDKAFHGVDFTAKETGSLVKTLA